MVTDMVTDNKILHNLITYMSNNGFTDKKIIYECLKYSLYILKNLSLQLYIKLNNYHIELNKYIIMLYNYNNYSFNIVFNSDKFSIQIENDNKLYSNIFTFEEIKIINNFFN